MSQSGITCPVLETIGSRVGRTRTAHAACAIFTGRTKPGVKRISRTSGRGSASARTDLVVRSLRFRKRSGMKLKERLGDRAGGDQIGLPIDGPSGRALLAFADELFCLSGRLCLDVSDKFGGLSWSGGNAESSVVIVDTVDPFPTLPG